MARPPHCVALVVGCLLAASHAIAGGSAGSLYPADEIHQVRISPNGEWVVAIARFGRVNGILAQRFGHAEIQPVETTRRYISRVDFVGADTLLVQFYGDDQSSSLRVDFEATERDGFQFRKEWFNPPGHLVDPLPLVDDVLLWAFRHRGRESVRRIELAELVGFKIIVRGLRRAVDAGTEVAAIDGVIHGWIVDRNGVPVVARRRDENGYSIFYREGADAELREIASFESGGPGLVMPFGLSNDGRNLIVTAYHGHDTIGLFEFDPRKGQFVDEIFHRRDADIVDVVVDPVTRDVLSAVYEIGGSQQHYYLESSRALYATQLGPSDPPLDELRIVSSTEDRQKFIYHELGPAEPGAHYLRSVATGETVLVGRIAKHIDRSKLAPTESFRVASEDGTLVEAFLTLPREASASPFPLVVMPHGGPIGVRDSLAYDPIVQYLASWGFAVLQPNYRGSSGYGRSFQEAGKKEWAKGIEDDIDAAVERATARPEIDEERVCIIGISYGGFSAIASVLRHPRRYRCASTINGVSDIPLVGESSDIADSARVLEEFESNVGDLETERERLLEISPAYHLRDVETPILVVYGDEDRRVDKDHAARVAMMLWLYGKEYEDIEVRGGRHSFTRIEWIRVLPLLRKFLTRHLMPSVRYRPDARTKDSIREWLRSGGANG